jgi:truncated hemoglobin YjbI
MSEDKLKTHRNAEKIGKESRDRFFEWLNTNCTKAVSHEEAREITRKIKKNIGDIVKR